MGECHFAVELDVIEWNTLFTNWRRGANDPSANGANAINVTYAAMDPFFAMVRFLQSEMAPPTSNNWGFIDNPDFDALVDKAVAAGGTTPRPAQDLGFMYSRSFDDLDGHTWEFVHMVDASKALG